MTLIVVVLLGAGVLLISSSLDCTPIKDTFQKIVSGQQIDYSGSNNNCQGSSNITFDLSNLAQSTGITQATQANPNAPGVGSDCTKFHTTNKLPNGFDCSQCNAWNMLNCAGGAFWLSKDFCANCSDCSAWNIDCPH